MPNLLPAKKDTASLTLPNTHTSPGSIKPITCPKDTKGRIVKQYPSPFRTRDTTGSEGERGNVKPFLTLPFARSAQLAFTERLVCRKGLMCSWRSSRKSCVYPGREGSMFFSDFYLS